MSENIKIEIDNEGIAWAVFNTAGRHALLNLNNIVLGKSGGIIKSTCLQAIREAVDKNQRAERNK